MLLPWICRGGGGFLFDFLCVVAVVVMDFSLIFFFFIANSKTFIKRIKNYIMMGACSKTMILFHLDHKVTHTK